MEILTKNTELLGTNTQSSSQIVSRQRVTEHGEVYTAPREVNAMLDLVKDESFRIDSRFLEPACGTGNFMTAILERKLATVTERYGKSRLEFERYALLALGAIYGIDILPDNVAKARELLLGIFSDTYTKLFKEQTDPACIDAASFILYKNIIWADALSMKLCGSPDLKTPFTESVKEEDKNDIVFSEWSLVNGLFKRRDFMFNNLTERGTLSSDDCSLFSDLGDEAVIFNPQKEFPLRAFSELRRDE